MLIIPFVLLCTLSAPAQPTFPTDAEIARNWTTFRGSAAGIVTGAAPTDWDGPTNRNILWKTPIALPGRNSPIVWNDSIFLSGATKERQDIYCINADTGAIRWQKTVATPDPTKAPRPMEDTGFAAPTMTTDGQRVFAMFATGDLFALDFTGNVLWTKSFGPLDNQYGHSTSLLMWHDRLIVQLDQGIDARKGLAAILAFNSRTGEQIWKAPRPVANSWSSPILIASPTGPQVITTGNPFAIAYEPEKGAEIWRAKCLEGDVAPSAAYANGLVFVAMETSIGSALKLGGSGDVTKTHSAWTIEASLPDIVSPLATDKFVFTVTTFGTATCHDITNGKKLWDHEFEGPFHASPLLIGNVVHVIDRKGRMQRFEAAAQFKALPELALGEPASATPAVVNGRMYIRGEDNLYAIGSR